MLNKPPWPRRRSGDEVFARSPAFARLTDSQQRRAGAVTEYFARYTYTHIGLSPHEWDRGAVIACCTEILPQKISAGAEFFAPVAGRAGAPTRSGKRNQVRRAVEPCAGL
jgi:hypothetical protein